MLRLAKREFLVFFVLVVGICAKLPSGAPWTTFTGKGSRVYARSVEPSSNFNEIQSQYAPKSPIFPKFVDPKIIIAKKSEILNDIFGGLYNYGSKYGSSAPENVKSNGNFGTDKNGFFGPLGPANSMGYGPFGPYGYTDFRGFAPKFSEKFGPNPEMARGKRSVEIQASKPGSKNKGLPPPYPGLRTIPEEPENPKTSTSLKKTPLQFLPYIPYAPYKSFSAPAFDPSLFPSKNSLFFENFDQNTNPPPSSITDEPTTSTIVPPDFWLPSSFTPGPTEYVEKVSDFLGKLFENLRINATKMKSSESMKYNFVRDLESGAKKPEIKKKVARSVEDFYTIANAKDAIVDSILSELSILKGDLIAILDDFAAYEKVSKKSSKTADPLPKTDPSFPFKQRMLMISQIFDTLTELQRNITSNIQSAVNARINEDSFNSFSIPGSNTNITLIDAIRNKMGVFDPSNNSYEPKISQNLNPFWASFAQENSGNGMKRQASDFFSGDRMKNFNDYENSPARNNWARFWGNRYDRQNYRKNEQ